MENILSDTNRLKRRSYAGSIMRSQCCCDFATD